MDIDRWQLLLKELDLIDNTISRLDVQIQNSKAICITLWTAWNGWFLSNRGEYKNELGTVLLYSILFPVLFWTIDYYFRKALLTTTRRQGIISLHLNSEENNKKNKSTKSKKYKLPVLDPVGWIYDYDVIKLLNEPNDIILKDRKRMISNNLTFWKVISYKEAIWFYGALIVASIFLVITF